MLSVQGKINDKKKDNLDDLDGSGKEITVKKSDGTVLFRGILTEIEIEEYNFIGG